MSKIRRLDVLRVRNLSDVRIEPSDRINILYGENGSGKTSLLEAIHLLGVGRSFRSPKLDPIIQHESDGCVVFGELLNGVSIGLSKSRRVREHALKLMGERQRNFVEVARSLPVQILNSESFSLLEGPSKVRRRFLDWGVFHVEHDFASDWRRASKCLSQRNQLLKQKSVDRAQLAAWDDEFTELSACLDSSRARYFELFLPVFLGLVEELIGPLPGLSISYFRGWRSETSLKELLSASLLKDIKIGATQYGPHRADLRVRIGQLDAVEILSRGQQKLLICALKIAQGQQLSLTRGMQAVYLVDDLPSELDLRNRQKVCRVLERLNTQIFLTCSVEDELEGCWSSGVLPRKFHVEHGKIRLS